MKLPLRRAVVLAATMAALAVALPSTALAQPHAKEYKLADAAVPADIAKGPDGALYIPDGSLSRLWRVTTQGRVSSIEVGVGPAGVTAGPDGALWVTDRSIGQIHRVTTGGQVTSYPLPDTRAFPTDIVAGPDGALWFTEMHADKIGRITTDGEVTEYPIPTAGASPGDIALGLVLTSQGLFIAEGSAMAIAGMSLSGAFDRPVRTKSSPELLTLAPDGAIWYASGNEGKVGRLAIDG